MTPAAAAGGPHRAAPVAALLFNACIWGLSWWPFRALAAQGLHALWATALTYALCTVLLLLARPRAWRAFADEPLLWALALAAGTANLGFNWAVTVGDVVRVVLLFYLMPVWSLLLAWPLLGERPTRLSGLRVALALVGVLIVLHPSSDTSAGPLGLADGLALLAGFAFAYTNILLRKLHQGPAASGVLAMFGGGAALAGLAAALGTWSTQVAQIPALSVGGWSLVAGVATAFLIANLALQYGAAHLPAHTTALVMLSEVVFAAVSSVAWGAAEWSLRTACGSVFIVAAAAASAWPARRAAPQP